MASIRKQDGFSLTEMLLATAIMAIGLVLIATIFPVGVKLTGMSVERSVASVAADEAFAKVRLCGFRQDPNDVTCTDYAFVGDLPLDINNDMVVDTKDDPLLWQDFLYPSTILPAPESPKHHWSALCRLAPQEGRKAVQVTVFVTHKTFGGMMYYRYIPGSSPTLDASWPMPVRVSITYDDSAGKENILYLADDAYFTASEASRFFDEGYTIVDDYTGTIYRIAEMRDDNNDGVRDIVLYKPWRPDTDNPTDGAVWVVPPGEGSDRYPCLRVAQQVIHFD